MADILLDRYGDLCVTDEGDIIFGESVVQKICIRLKMFENEWRWNRNEGLPYFDYLFGKKPDTDYLEAAVRARIFEVPEVTDVKDVRVRLDSKTRKGTISFVAYTDQETIRREVKIHAGIRSYE